MRRLTNSLLGGFLAALLLTQALLLLNPEVPLDISTVWRVWGTLAVTYGLAAGLSFWLLLVVVEAIRGQPLQPAWFSFRLLTWLLMLVLALGAVLLWHNLFHFRLYLTHEAIRAIAAAATTLSAAAAILLVLGLFRYSFGRRGVAIGYALVLLATTASILLPFYFRPPSSERARVVPRLPLADTPLPRRLTIIGIEGASMSYVLPAVAAGRLPNFARLIEGGTAGALKTLYPTESLAIWTSVATGKLPRQHGLTGFYRYRLPGVEPLFSRLPDGIFMPIAGTNRAIEESCGIIATAPLPKFLEHLKQFWRRRGARPVVGNISRRESERFHRLRAIPSPSARELRSRAASTHLPTGAFRGSEGIRRLTFRDRRGADHTIRRRLGDQSPTTTSIGSRT